MTDNLVFKKRAVSGLLLAALGVASMMTTGCPSSSGSSGTFTAAEKKAMTTKSAPPKEAVEAMSKMKTGKPDANVTSPWSKPQK